MIMSPLRSEGVPRASKQLIGATTAYPQASIKHLVWETRTEPEAPLYSSSRSLGPYRPTVNQHELRRKKCRSEDESRRNTLDVKTTSFDEIFDIKMTSFDNIIDSRSHSWGFFWTFTNKPLDIDIHTQTGLTFPSTHQSDMMLLTLYCCNATRVQLKIQVLFPENVGQW